MDGVKKQLYKAGEIREKVSKVIHVDAHGINSDTLTKDISPILKIKAFNKFTMAGDIRLVSQYNWSHGDHKKEEKIKRYIMI